jgi:hypothetical protein
MSITNRIIYICILCSMAIHIAGCASSADFSDKNSRTSAWTLRSPDPDIPTENPY